MTTERKLFTAELKRLQAQTDGAGFQPANGDVLKALNDIKAELKALGHLVKGEEPPPTEEQVQADTVLQQKQAEVSMLKTELRALAVCIEQTKSEIAALKPSEAGDDRLAVVASELDAIVIATERATQQILESAEKVEALTREIRSMGGDTYVSRLAEDINDAIVTMYEACNFQDITGQRITKVVRTLKYIEARIMAMIDIWGPDNIAEIIPKTHEEHKNEETALLNGPALENQGISQDEIDKLFG